MFDINIGSLVLQRLGFFSDTVLKRTTNSIEIWRNILNPDKMMDGETLTVLLEWTIHGSPSNDKLGLPEAPSKTWLDDRSFWQSWEQNNEPQPVPWVKCKEWVCIEREPIWGTEVNHNRLCKLLDICFSTCIQDIDPKDGGLVNRCALPDQDRPNTDLDGTQFMTCDYIKGTKGHYMPRESFLYFRKYERMIEKITLPTPIHLLDHIIIPINIRKSHWLPAHINLQTRSISLLDSSQVYSAAAYPQQKMLIWKFFRMVWTSHVSAVAPGPYWTIPPERFIGLHPRLTDLTPVMMQTLRHRIQVSIRSIMDTTNDHIRTRWNRRGIRPELAGTQSTDPPGQNWTELEQPGTPQQNNFTNTKETRLACGIYTVLSALYAVRNWKIDFVLQAHISQARNWMAAIGHAINEVVSLYRCRCGQNYEQWEDQPTPPCPTCEKTRLRKTRPGKRERESDEITDKRTKYEDRTDEGKTEKNDPPQETKQTPTSYALPDPTPDPRKRTPAVHITTPPEAPTSRFRAYIKQESALKKAENSHSSREPREPERNTERSPSLQRSGRGLRNTGNTCFLNATIQCLGAIDKVNQLHPLTNESTTT